MPPTKRLIGTTERSIYIQICMKSVGQFAQCTVNVQFGSESILKDYVEVTMLIHI